MKERSMDGKTIILRLEIDTQQAYFGKAVSAIEAAGGDIVAIDVIQTDKQISIRDLTVKIAEAGAAERLQAALQSVPGIRLRHVSDRTFLLHLGGKITIQPKTPIQNRDDLSRVYTPDVARVCQAIEADPKKAFTLTIKRNTVAVVSDGSAVLGLGNIGPYAAMPVMEGKAMLFKQFADVDAFPICLDTQDTEQIIASIKHLAPAFGGINLEDISAPRCFEIERRLREELDIPVFHDDQHGTAVVLYAGLLNALKLTKRKIEDTRFVVCGIGAAGTACTKMLLAGGAKHIVGVDREGILTADKTYSHPMWQWYAENTNEARISGGLTEALANADVFIGVSAGGILTREHIQSMAPEPIVFAMANPEPEIRPELAEDIVAVMATGRSDYPNQINNVLCFPGIFRGALDSRAVTINEQMKLAAAEAIASVINEDELSRFYIIPSVFNARVVEEVRKRVIQAAQDSGAARRRPRE
ncbi:MULTISPECIES: NAD-dependent malic enzyme [unclassified Paenibacillus]|uniref:NAD-dependent malic enzyme n=1 Tax=unclassified Paenibacillus TaxID=185978 RepID=UPI0010501216|nr:MULTISPECIES: NAD-dependent malic enzyme [unclassified Paenibacillus]NIK70321.1 malate dehydrogenase (oxaloacetate-decarboxylating) [Paenibacillus sp. BK720]TCM90755.1 malate dehydrogenase (oxaloacetate-decarboxylating) [Paenibacillus sp. BK033]